jgi:hypothetical protein
VKTVKFSSDKKLVMSASRMTSTDLVMFVLDLENASYSHSAHIEFGILIVVHVCIVYKAVGFSLLLRVS